LKNRDSGIEFAERILTILDRGSFTATYKYAVLMGLIDLCIEHAGRQGEPPTSVTTRQIAAKVLAAYWPQARPFQKKGVLRQNKGAQAALLSRIKEFRAGLDEPSVSLARLSSRCRPEYEALLTKVEWILVEMPLPRLQVLGPAENRFIYEIQWTTAVTRGQFNDASTFDNRIHFVGDAAGHLVRLAGLLRPVLHREWSVMVARINDLPESELDSFLFGAARRAPRPLVRDLRELQGNSCFYCLRELKENVEVDHFIPWARHPDDGITNLVLAHGNCNGAKSDHMAATPHLQRWASRAESHGAELVAIADRHDWQQDAEITLGTARGIYFNLASTVPLWVAGRQFAPLDHGTLLASFA